MTKNIETARTFEFQGRTYTEDQVRVVDLDYYLYTELFSPLNGMFEMMAEHDQSRTGPLGNAGRIGMALTSSIGDRVESVFFSETLKSLGIQVVVAKQDTDCVPNGTIMQVICNGQHS